MCLHELYTPWFRAKQSLCSIVYFQLSLHIRVKELIVLMSSTDNINPSHGNPIIYPQVSMQPPSTNLLKMCRIVIGGWTSRSRVRSGSRHRSAMKTNTLESKRQRDALEKKYVVWTIRQGLIRYICNFTCNPIKEVHVYVYLLLY